tara:strand:+ start:1692 stop:2972 length:1281 start_codon:yes stop_codon:yes gene_type:complete
MVIRKYKICVIGLGYVGLPLAVEFGKYYETIGFDLNKERISNLNNNIDLNHEMKSKQIKRSTKVKFTYSTKDISDCNIYIVCVPTPINKQKKPDLKSIISATILVSKVLSRNDIVVYESTVYPGLTEEICIPLLEKKSDLKFNEDFFLGYSPERINPGDKVRTLTKIKKVVSGSNKKTKNILKHIYGKIIKAGVYVADSIKTAEAAKVIENTQRDLNIALINEFTQLFKKLNLNPKNVFDAAKTKWNYLDFKPGIVGGHCIGVDPYYLTYKAKQINFKPNIILAGRSINDSIASRLAVEIKNKINKKIKKNKIKLLIMGFTFKENCSDFRNTKVIDIYEKLISFGFSVDIFDPWIDRVKTQKEYKSAKLKIIKKIKKNCYSSIVLCVSHDYFKKLGYKGIKSYCKKEHIIFDIKNTFKEKQVVQLL